MIPCRVSDGRLGSQGPGGGPPLAAAPQGAYIPHPPPRTIQTTRQATQRRTQVRLHLLHLLPPRVSEPLAEEVVGLNLSEEEVERRRGGTGWQELLDKKLYKIDTEVRRVGRASEHQPFHLTLPSPPLTLVHPTLTSPYFTLTSPPQASGTWRM